MTPFRNLLIVTALGGFVFLLSACASKSAPSAATPPDTILATEDLLDSLVVEQNLVQKVDHPGLLKESGPSR